MLTGLIVFFGLSFLILAHEAGHLIAAKLFGLKVEEFGFGFPPRITAFRRNETTYTINWLPFGGFVRIAGENDRLMGNLDALSALPENERRHIFLFQPAWRRSVIVLAGVFVNFLIGWFLISVVFLAGTPQTLMITGVQAGSPAEGSGFTEGDIVKGFFRSKDFIGFVNERRGTPISITVIRQNKEFVLVATPRLVIAEGEGALGVLLDEYGSAPRGLIPAFRDGFRESVNVLVLTIVAFGELMKNLFASGIVPADIAGPVGIFSVAQDAGKIGMVYLLQLLAIISINLCVVNLIPFPALDGGRFFLILVEKIKGSPIPLRAEALVNGLGFIFLMGLLVLVTLQDISRLF